jgi:hypothetical protein
MNYVVPNSHTLSGKLGCEIKIERILIYKIMAYVMNATNIFYN